MSLWKWEREEFGLIFGCGLGVAEKARCRGLAVVEGCDCAVQSGVVTLAEVQCRWKSSQVEFATFLTAASSPATVTCET